MIPVAPCQFRPETTSNYWNSNGFSLGEKISIFWNRYESDGFHYDVERGDRTFGTRELVGRSTTSPNFPPGIACHVVSSGRSICSARSRCRLPLAPSKEITATVQCYGGTGSSR